MVGQFLILNAEKPQVMHFYQLPLCADFGIDARLHIPEYGHIHYRTTHSINMCRISSDFLFSVYVRCSYSVCVYLVIRFIFTGKKRVCFPTILCIVVQYKPCYMRLCFATVSLYVCSMHVYAFSWPIPFDAVYVYFLCAQRSYATIFFFRKAYDVCCCCY